MLHEQDTGADLQEELENLLCLAVLGDHVRWVVVDDEELADALAADVPRWRALADEVARRLVTLDVAPDARVRALAKDIPVNWVPEGWLDREQAETLLLHRVGLVASWTRIRAARSTDAAMSEFLESVAARLDQSGVPAANIGSGPDGRSS